MTKEERELRNYRIYALFLAGNSEREIGRFVGITGQRVHQILEQELKNASRHQELLIAEARKVYRARLETLLKATWPGVAKGDMKAISEARRLVEQQARFDGIADGSAPAALPTVGLQEAEDVDELTRYRMQRRRRPDPEPELAPDAAGGDTP
jgi:hypothetical protein